MLKLNDRELKATNPENVSRTALKMWAADRYRCGVSERQPVGIRYLGDESIVFPIEGI